MDTRRRGFYLAMDYERGGDRWRHIAGPFPTADDAFDATVDERAYGAGYVGCSLRCVDGQGYRSEVAHPRSERGRERAEREAWRRERGASRHSSL